MYRQFEYFEEYQGRVRALIGAEGARRLVSQALVLVTVGGNDFVNNYKPRSKVILEEMSGQTSSNPQEETVVPSSSREEEKEITESRVLPRRSGRVIRKPDRFEANVIVTDTNDEDPASYQEAMVDPDRDEWQNAMNLEMESMDFNSVWTLVDLPDGFKPIGCKWIYKRKRGADGRVETVKARLVAKGYNQKEEVDYK